MAGVAPITLCDEEGFTLVELLMAATIALVIVLASLTALDGSSRLASSDNERALAIGHAQSGLDQMVRELRHTRTVHSAAAQLLEVTVAQRGVERRVQFDCSVAEPGRAGLRRCVRTIVSGPAAGTTEPMVTGVGDVGDSSTVFTYTPATGTAKHVTVRVGVALDGGKVGGHTGRTVLDDGTSLRNVGV